MGAWVHLLSDVDESGRTAFCAGCDQRVSVVSRPSGRLECRPKKLADKARYRARNAEGIRAADAEYRAGEGAAVRAAWRAANPQPYKPQDRTPEQRKRQNLWRLYKIRSLSDVSEDPETCPICLRRGLPMTVDHDHACCRGEVSCGKCVRGVLCRSCNFGLGRFEDDPERMLSAVAFLQQWADRERVS